MTEAEIRVATTLLDEEGRSWVEAVRTGRWILVSDCGVHGVFDSKKELLNSLEYYGAKHSETRKYNLGIKKINSENLMRFKEIAVCDVAPGELFDCYSELYAVFEAFSNGETSEEETLQKFKELGYDFH